MKNKIIIPVFALTLSFNSFSQLKMNEILETFPANSRSQLYSSSIVNENGDILLKQGRVVTIEKRIDSNVVEENEVSLLLEGKTTLLNLSSDKNELVRFNKVSIIVKDKKYVTEDREIIKAIVSNSHSTMLTDSLIERLRRDDQVQTKVELTKQEKKEKFLRSIKKTASLITATTMKPFIAISSWASGALSKKDSQTKKTVTHVLTSNMDEINGFVKLNEDLNTADLIANSTLYIEELLYTEIEEKTAAQVDKISKSIEEKINSGEKIDIAQIKAMPEFQEIQEQLGIKIDDETLEYLANKVNDGQSIEDILSEIPAGFISEEQIALLEKGIKDSEVIQTETNEVAVTSAEEQNELSLESEQKGATIEGITTLALTNTIPTILAFNIFGKALGWTTFGVLTASQVVTAITVKKCLESKFEQEKDIQMCNYIINRNSRHLLRSYIKAKDSGYKFRTKVQEWNKKRKEKKATKAI